MAKSQKRSNREVRKPKATTLKAPVAIAKDKVGLLKGLENIRNGVTK